MHTYSALFACFSSHGEPEEYLLACNVAKKFDDNTVFHTAIMIRRKRFLKTTKSKDNIWLSGVVVFVLVVVSLIVYFELYIVNSILILLNIH